MRKIEERYISLLTDFGFKRIFGTDPNKELLINFLNSLFDGEEVIKDVKLREYEDSLKAYRDIKNSLDTAKEEGREEGREQRNIEIAKKMLAAGMDIDIIINMTDLSKDEIEKLTIQQYVASIHPLFGRFKNSI